MRIEQRVGDLRQDPNDIFNKIASISTSDGFLGTKDGRKYSVGIGNNFSIIQEFPNVEFFEVAEVIERDLYIHLVKKHEKVSVAHTFGCEGIDVLKLLSELEPLQNPGTRNHTDAFKELPQMEDNLFNVWEDDGTGGTFGTIVYVSAESKDAARQKYLDWCETNNYWHGILAVQSRWTHFDKLGTAGVIR
jgi:hypothetical protein